MVKRYTSEHDGSMVEDTRDMQHDAVRRDSFVLAFDYERLEARSKLLWDLLDRLYGLTRKQGMDDELRLLIETVLLTANDGEVKP